MSEALVNINNKGYISSAPSVKDLPIASTNYDVTPTSVSENSSQISSEGVTVSPKGIYEKLGLSIPNNEVTKDSFLRFEEGNYIEPWKLVEDLSARLIDQYDDIVLLECLVDREAKIYIETELEKRLFEGFSLEAGALFKLSKYTRRNESRFVVRAKPQLVSDLDFPKIDFQKKYGDNFFNPAK